jgi:hypothetical protein
MNLNEVSGQIVDAAMKVRTALGPGLLMNFNVVHLKDGIKRMVNNL